jgi:hypothetical protein
VRRRRRSTGNQATRRVGRIYGHPRAFPGTPRTERDHLAASDAETAKAEIVERARNVVEGIRAELHHIHLIDVRV